MLQLRYSMERDIYTYVTVLGDADGIRNLYWQLTKNYKCQDGTGIANICVLNLDGLDITESVMARPYSADTALSHLY